MWRPVDLQVTSAQLAGSNGGYPYRLYLQSTPGHGTCFTVLLPLVSNLRRPDTS